MILNTNCTINVIRRSTSTKNAYGEPIYTTSTVYSSIPARIDFYNGKTEYHTQGERPINKVVLIVDGSYSLQAQDEVTNSIDSKTRVVVAINPAFGQMAQLHHYEIDLQDKP